MVATEACSRATWDSSAIVTLSRKRRCTRTLTVRSNHVAAVDTPSAIAAIRTSRASCPSTPSPSSLSHQAINASGNAARSDSTNAATIRPGSFRSPSLHNRHIDDSAGGRSSGEDFINDPLLVLDRGEALGLKVEHRPVASPERHQLLVGSELDHFSMLEHTDAVGVAHRREAVRNENRRAMSRGGEDAVENL